MALEWKRILLDGDAAVLTSADPEDIGTTAAVGISEEASRADHVHRMGDGSIDVSTLFVGEVVDTAAIADDAVTSDKIASLTAALDFAGQQAQDMVLHTVANATARDLLTPALGKVVWQTDELHPYICTSVG